MLHRRSLLIALVLLAGAGIGAEALRLARGPWQPVPEGCREKIVLLCADPSWPDPR